MEKYIMAIDEGTTSTRAILFNHAGEIVSVAQKEFTQYFAQEGWVEHDANEIWLALLACMSECIMKSHIDPSQVAGIGITNQRETAVIWNKDTGLPIYKAIVWQSRQTVDICNDLIEKGYNETFHKKTGLRIDPYFSATKYRWILDHVDGAKQLAEQGKLLCGTMDTWIVYCLSGGEAHVTDYTNASRTLLYNIYDLCWDEELCSIMDIPMNMLPEVKDSSCIYAHTAPYHFFNHEVPICAIAGDQQSALFGQSCFMEGEAKNTYGTGGFLLMNTGTTPKESNDGLLTTIAWGLDGKISYALEGSIFVSGSAIQWLRDEMEFFEKSSESESYANQANKESGVMVVPAFVGLGAPYWDDSCRGAIFGITRGTTKYDITKATLDSLAYQTRDVLDAMAKTCQVSIPRLRVDGGACANNYLMHKQADIMQCSIIRPSVLESTALGAARLAALAINYWTMDDIRKQDSEDTIFEPSICKEEADAMYDRWQKAVSAARMFTK